MNHCGTCTACCRVYAIPALDKPAGKWCEHCAVGQGCKIYDQRPPLCSEFKCVWLEIQESGKRISDELRPDRCKVVFSMSTNDRIMAAFTMPGAPLAWQRPSVRRLIDSMVKGGLAVVVGQARSTTRTMIDDRGERTVHLTKPDENGMQWSVPEKLPLTCPER